MKPWHGWLSLALAIVFLCIPTASAGAIYKCTINGSTVYRDQACATEKPGLGRLSAPAASQTDAVVSSNPAALIDGIQRLSTVEREQHAQYDREVERLRSRMAGVSDKHVQQREVEQLNDAWKARFAETGRQRQALVDRLRQLCPHGASGGSGQTTCER